MMFSCYDQEQDKNVPSHHFYSTSYWRSYAIKQGKETKGMQVGIEGKKLSIHRYIDYVSKRFQRIFRNPLESINEFSKVTGYKINI